MVSCILALLLFLCLFCKGSRHSLFSLLSYLTALVRKNKLYLEGALGWLIQGFLLDLRGSDHYSPADSWPCPPTNACCCISLDQLPKEGRFVETWFFVQSSHSNCLGIHKI